MIDYYELVTYMRMKEIMKQLKEQGLVSDETIAQYEKWVKEERLNVEKGDKNEN